MAYINKEDVKAIREELKATFPELKFGVKKMHGGSNGVDVTIKSGSTDFTDCFTHGDGYAQINQYHTHMYGKHQSLFDEIYKIIKTAPINGEGYHKGTGWFDKSDSMTDYFHTAYYISMNVGSWDKPYQQAA